VLGDLFQQYAAKYIGIGRGIPLSNTNQLWGLAWGALVFGELSGLGFTAQALVIAGSLIMIAGAASIGFAEAKGEERNSWRDAVQRECDRYGLDAARVTSALEGNDPLGDRKPKRHWWEALVGVAAIGVFVYLAAGATRPAIAVNTGWILVLAAASLVLLVFCGMMLWKHTRFS
jgi:drug/metabolite transporter (DMT)-like permease